MATRIENLLTKIRQDIGDERATKWTDINLLNLIDDAQRDIAQQAEVLRDTLAIDVVPFSETLDLPEKTIRITRAIYKGLPLPLRSHEEMDVLNASWQERFGTEVEALVYDRYDQGLVRPYPLISAVTRTFVWDSGEGMPINIVGFTATGDGMPISIEFADVLVSTEGDGGIIDIQATATGELIKIYYTKNSEEISNTADALEISDQWDKAIRFYVDGMALKQDNDAANIARSASYLSDYGRELTQVINRASLNSTRANREMQYRRV